MIHMPVILHLLGRSGGSRKADSDGKRNKQAITCAAAAAAK
jgi:hypothetical protein